MSGAVSGAIIALNLFYGRNKPSESPETAYIAVKKLINILIYLLK